MSDENMAELVCAWCSGMGYEDYPTNKVPCRITKHYEYWRAIEEREYNLTAAAGLSAFPRQVAIPPVDLDKEPGHFENFQPTITPEEESK